MIRPLALWWRALCRRSEFERDLDAELAFHLAARSEDLQAAGLPAAQADRQARIELGMTGLQRDQIRRARGLTLFDILARDLRHAVRGLLRNPGFSLTALAVLGVALTANALLFSLFSAYALRNPPIAQPDRWVTLTATTAGNEHLAHWTEREADELIAAPSDGLEGVYLLREVRLTVSADGIRRASGEAVSANYFDLLGVRAARGRSFGADTEHRPVVLSHLGWQRLLGGINDPVGQRIELAGEAFNVIGVMPPEFTGTTPLLAMYWLRDRDYRALQAASGDNDLSVELGGLRRPDTSLAAVSAALSARASTFNPERDPAHHIAAAQATQRSGYLPARDRRALLQASLPVGLAFVLLLLVAAANLANLVLARFASRQHELAVRVALGAPRRRLLAQLLTECGLLALLAALLALGLAGLLLRPTQSALFGLMGDFGFDLLALRIDPSVLGYTLLLSLLATLAFGLVPALLATAPWRHGRARPELSARHPGSASGLRGALMVGQVAISVILLVLAGLVTANARKVDRTEIGFDPARTLALHVWPPSPTLIRELDALPQVEQISGTSRAPLMGSPHRADVRIGDRSESLLLRAVTPAYTGMFNIELLSGRGLNDADAAGARVALVSQRTAERLWPGRNAIGQVIELPPQESLGALPVGRFEVVGVVEDVVSGWFIDGLDASALYLPAALDQRPIASLMLRTRDATPATLDAIARRCLRVAPQLDCELMSMLGAVRIQRLPFLVASRVTAALGWTALAISWLGLYGLISYLVVQKRREIGVRLALGAPQRRVTGEIVAVAARQIALGIGIGLPLAFALSRLAAAVTDKLHTFDLLSFVAIPLALAALALLAAWLPARRSARVAPTEALRQD